MYLLAGGLGVIVVVLVVPLLRVDAAER